MPQTWDPFERQQSSATRTRRLMNDPTRNGDRFLFWDWLNSTSGRGPFVPEGQRDSDYFGAQGTRRERRQYEDFMKEYDFRSPPVCARHVKRQVTLRLSVDVIEYLGREESACLPKLINLYLSDCAQSTKNSSSNGCARAIRDSLPELATWRAVADADSSR